MSLGKAAVFKHIPVYYPRHVGAVGGVVGMVGGLAAPVAITFGMLNDVVGIGKPASCRCLSSPVAC